MKNSLLLKSVIDVLFFFHVVGLFAIVLWFPLDVIDGANMEPLHLLEWFILIMYCISCLIFLRGLFFLRKVARELLQNKIFTKPTAYATKISGYHFVFAGMLFLLGMLSEKLSQLNFEFLPGVFSITPVFYIMVGLFFTIQSEILLKAIDIKGENDLTI